MYVHALVEGALTRPIKCRGGVFSERLDRYVDVTKLPALEENVVEWSKEHPMIWNVGIGPAASSFVPTLTRLLFDRTKDINGPYDYIIRVRLPSPSSVAASSTTAQHWLAFEVLKELAKTLETSLPEDIKQLAPEESYFDCKVSEKLMLQAFGRRYIDFFGSHESMWRDPIYYRHPFDSPTVERTREALRGKRHLLLHVKTCMFPSHWTCWFSYWVAGGHIY
jgi:hypothetical protein